MRSRSAYLIVLAVCLCLVSSLGATSVIVALRKGKIILAADTRQDRLDPTPTAVAHEYHDDGCKIVLLGSAAAGLSGGLDYVRNDP